MVPSAAVLWLSASGCCALAPFQGLPVLHSERQELGLEGFFCPTHSQQSQESARLNPGRRSLSRAELGCRAVPGGQTAADLGDCPLLRPQPSLGPAPLCPHLLPPGQSHTCASGHHSCLTWDGKGPLLLAAASAPSS